MSRYAVVLDACALVPIVLADTLLRIAERGLYRPLWSSLILSEASTAVQEIHPEIAEDRIQHRFDDMQTSFDDALVTGWEDLEAGLSLPDPDDRHVLAAAIRGSAQAIVTFNLADFPQAKLEQFGLEVTHPDDFLLDQLDLSPPAILEVIREQAGHTKRPTLTLQDLAVRLGRAGVPRFADEIIRHL
jgi:predicted nucleic acid-binding protein